MNRRHTRDIWHHGREKRAWVVAAVLGAIGVLLAPGHAWGAAVPYLVKDINPGTVASSPFPLASVGSTLYFSADDGTNGAELWKSDGTADGTVLVKDINPGVGSSAVSGLTAVGSTACFAANNGSNGAELWKSDGTAAGTVLVKDILPGAAGSNLSELTAVGGTLYLNANDGITGLELWKSDGTAAGTVLVKDIRPGVSSASPDHLTAMGSTLYFQGRDGTNGAELWKSDGTSAGTVMVKNINPGSADAYLGYLTVVGSTLYFQARTATNGDELWKSDGSTAGTVLVKDIWPGASGSAPYGLAAMGGTLYFAADDGTNGYELWKSDGTEAGTVLVKDINPGADSWPDYFTAVGGTLYFIADDGTNGWELWKSDGTAAGTVLVKDINPGAADSSPWDLTAVNGTLYFSAEDGTHGYELWTTDGTEAGTVMLADSWPGTTSSDPRQLTAAGATLFFTAAEPATETELWALAICGNTIVEPGETCDDGNTTPGDGCDASCQIEPPVDHYVAYKVAAPKKDAAGVEIPNNVFPKGWVITVDDVQLDDADADDPENFEVKKAQSLLNPSAKNTEGGPENPALHYLRYQMKSSKESVGAANPDGSFNKPPKHVPRVWQLTNQFGTVNVQSKKVSALLLPAAKSLTAPPAAPSDATHFVCYQVKPTADVTTQTPNGKFAADLQAFFKDQFDDCALNAAGNPSFDGTAVAGMCLFDLKNPKELCNPMNKSAVELPRETTAVIDGSTAGATQSLLCYGLKLAGAFSSTSAATLAGASVGASVDPKQSKHAAHTVKSGNPVYTTPGNQFPNPTVLDTKKQEMVCIPTDVLGVAPAP